ncbi:MAG: thioredoxin family protein [Gemmataceae bacterium]|nr:thioredoxin family protein [Gemmataceae bacterium]
MVRRAAALAVLLALAPAGRADDPKPADKPKPAGPPAADLLDAGLAAARKDGKAVFVAFGSPGCVWCKYLDKYHDRPAVKKALGRHLVFVKIDVEENPGGQALYDKYAPEPGGVPTWVILSADGKVLADSFEPQDGGKKFNVGFPAEPNELAHYEKVLRAAVPKLTDGEVKLLMDELRDTRPKPDEKDGGR